MKVSRAGGVGCEAGSRCVCVVRSEEVRRCEAGSEG